MKPDKGVLRQALEKIIGTERTDRLFKVLVIHPAIAEDAGPEVSRAVIAQALNMLLFEDLLDRVPAAKLYVERCLARGQDRSARSRCRPHGRSCRHGRPAGRRAGHHAHPPPAGVRAQRALSARTPAHDRPLPRPVGLSRRHRTILYQRASSRTLLRLNFSQPSIRVTATSIDPVTPQAEALLQKLEETRSLTVDEAATLLPILVSCFGRQHQEATLADYEILLAESPEMAWISTEGNAFNHATDRVADVDQLAAEQKALGQPMKAAVETSQSGRVRQTAFHAARVLRKFRAADGSLVEREVPGSFYEFITRLPLPEKDGKSALDLSFDSSNAQAIFKMTANAEPSPLQKNHNALCKAIKWPYCHLESSSIHVYVVLCSSAQLPRPLARTVSRRLRT